MKHTGKYSIGEVVRVVHLSDCMQHFGHIGQLGVITEFDHNGRDFFLDFGGRDICGWWGNRNVEKLSDSDNIHLQLIKDLDDEILEKRNFLENEIIHYNREIKKQEEKSKKENEE